MSRFSLDKNVQNFSSMFSEYKTWKAQLSTLLGDAEVSKFQNKLSSINVTGLDNYKLSVDGFFNLAETKVGVCNDGIYWLSNCLILLG